MRICVLLLVLGSEAHPFDDYHEKKPMVPTEDIKSTAECTINGQWYNGKQQVIAFVCTYEHEGTNKKSRECRACI